MNLRQIKSLFAINLLYANPQATSQSRRRKRSGRKLTRSLMLQFLLSSLVFLFIFTMVMLPIDFPRYPGYFGFYLVLYLVFVGSQSIGTLYNIFYESKDLKDYLPLPIASINIFAAKILTATYILLPYALPIFALFLMTGLRALGLLGIFLAFLAFLLTAMILLAVCSLFVAILAQSKLFLRYKKIATTLLLVLPLVFGMGTYLYIVTQNQSAGFIDGTIVDRPVIPLFTPVFDWMVRPLSALSGLGLLISLALLALILLFIVKRVVPKMFELQLQENTPSKKKAHKSTTTYKPLSRQLLHYNLGLVKNPTLWMQSLTGFIMPVAMLFGASSSGSLNLSSLSSRFFAALVLAGFGFAFLTMNTTSVVALIISLDRENYEYIRSLPASFLLYLRVKFRFAVGLQIILNTIVLLGIDFVLRLPVLLLLALLLGNAVSAWLIGQYYFYRDYRLLNLNWTNISQLYTRGGGNWLMVGLMFGGIFGSGIIVALTAVVLFFLPLPVLINAIILLIFSGIAFLIYRHYQKVFWKKL